MPPSPHRFTRTRPDAEDSNAATDDIIRYLTVELSARGIAEIQDNGPPVFVPRQEIRRIEFQRGSPAERLIVQIIAGIACFIVGVVCLLQVLAFISFGGVTSRYMGDGGIATIFGGWMIWTAIKPAYFLRGETDRDVRKIVFHGSVQCSEIERLLQRANRAWDYRIVSMLPDVKLGGQPYR
jgi:hypothetical protein